MSKKILLLAAVLYLGVAGAGVAMAQEAATDSTIAALQAQINQLTQLVQSLQAEVTASVSGGTTGGAVAAPEPTQTAAVDLSFNIALSAGMSGEEVSVLQGFLAADPEIYPEGLVTGYFGPLTEKAVQKFQEKYGVVSGGVAGYGTFGPKTREKAMAVASATAGSAAVSEGSVAPITGTTSALSPSSAAVQGTASSLSISSSAVTAGSSALTITESTTSTTTLSSGSSVSTSGTATGVATASQSAGSSLTGSTSSVSTSPTVTTQSVSSSSGSVPTSSTTTTATTTSSTTSSTTSTTSEPAVTTSTTSTSPTSSTSSGTSSTASEPTVTTSTSSAAATSSATLPRVYFASASFVTGTTTEAEVTIAIENVTGMLGYRVGVQVASPAQYKKGSIERINIGSGMGAENEDIYANGFLANWAVIYVFSGSTNMLKFRVTVPPGTSSIGLDLTEKSRLNDGGLPGNFEDTTLTIGGGAASAGGAEGLASVLNSLSALLKSLSESLGR